MALSLPKYKEWLCLVFALVAAATWAGTAVLPHAAWRAFCSAGKIGHGAKNREYRWVAGSRRVVSVVPTANRTGAQKKG